MFAFEKGANYVLPKKAFHFDKKMQHGHQYCWARSFFGLEDVITEEALDDLKLEKVRLHTWDDEPPHPCHVLLETTESGCLAEVPYSCDSDRRVTWNAVKSRLRLLYANATFKPTAARHLRPADVNVAWHVRESDIVLLGEARYYLAVMALVGAITGNRSLHVMFVSEKPLSKTFSFLSDGSVTSTANVTGTTFLPSMEPYDALAVMIHADVLVTSGSSFPAIAALFSTNIVIQAPDKGVHCANSSGVHDLSEHAAVDCEGHLRRPRLETLRRRTADYLHARKTGKDPTPPGALAPANPAVALPLPATLATSRKVKRKGRRSRG